MKSVVLPSPFSFMYCIKAGFHDNTRVRIYNKLPASMKWKAARWMDIVPKGPAKERPQVGGGMVLPSLPWWEMKAEHLDADIPEPWTHHVSEYNVFKCQTKANWRNKTKQNKRPQMVFQTLKLLMLMRWWQESCASSVGNPCVLSSLSTTLVISITSALSSLSLPLSLPVCPWNTWE